MFYYTVTSCIRYKNLVKLAQTVEAITSLSPVQPISIATVQTTSNQLPIIQDVPPSPNQLSSEQPPISKADQLPSRLGNADTFSRSGTFCTNCSPTNQCYYCLIEELSSQ